MLSKLNLNNLIVDDPVLNNVINTVYVKARAIWEEPLHIHFTNHKIDHCERILQDIDKLLDKPDRLSEKEKFVLICAVLLHDVGMQMGKYADTTNSLNNDEILEELRKKHHEYSAKAILESVQLDKQDKYNFGLDDKRDYTESIALVAKYHRKLNINEVQDKRVKSETIRQKLLCALLCLGDCLDIDSSRINIEKLKTINISTESKFFWYCHHYVSAHVIENQTITIDFTFPKKYETEKVLVEGISKHIKDEIQTHLQKVYQILFDYNVRINRTVNFPPEEYSLAMVDEMPPDLIKYIKEKEGLGEIDFYWGGDRDTANEKIIEYLKENELKNIFIAAIGFGTVSNVLGNEKIIEKIQDKILLEDQSWNNNSEIEPIITFVLPGGIRDLLNFRQDIDESKLMETYQKGQKLLIDFKKNLANKCFPNISNEEQLVKISKYIEIRKYVGSVPRHFILGSDDAIFFGAYLGHTTGKKSYMMMLTPKTEGTNDTDKLNNGLFTLFKNEIEHIKKKSKIKDDDK